MIKECTFAAQIFQSKQQRCLHCTSQLSPAWTG